MSYKPLIAVSLAIIILSVTCLAQVIRLDNLETKITEYGKTEPKECLDYTLREYREGNAPEKCRVEVYGDQF